MIAFPPGMRVWLAGDDARFLGRPRDGLAGLALDHRHEAVGAPGRGRERVEDENCQQLLHGPGSLTWPSGAEDGTG
jgi:hypothetical protein